MSKLIRISTETFAKLQAFAREGESIQEALERLIAEHEARQPKSISTRCDAGDGPRGRCPDRAVWRIRRTRVDRGKGPTFYLRRCQRHFIGRIEDAEPLDG